MRGFIENPTSGKVFPVAGMRHNPHAVDSMLQYGRLYVVDGAGRRVEVHELRPSGEYFLQRVEGLVCSSQSGSDSDSDSSSSDDPTIRHLRRPAATAAKPVPTPEADRRGAGNVQNNLAAILRARAKGGGAAASRAVLHDWMARTRTVRANTATGGVVRRWVKHVEPNGAGQRCSSVPHSPVVPVTTCGGWRTTLDDNDDDDDDHPWRRYHRGHFASDNERILTAEVLTVGPAAAGGHLVGGSKDRSSRALSLWGAALPNPCPARRRPADRFPSLQLSYEYGASMPGAQLTSLHLLHSAGAASAFCTQFGSAQGGLALVAPIGAAGPGGAPPPPPLVRSIKATVFCSEVLHETRQAVIGCNSRVVLFDIETGHVRRRVPLEKGVDCMAVKADTDHTHTAYCGLRNGHLRRLDVRAARLAPLQRLPALITGIEHAGGMIVTRSSDTALKVWDQRAMRKPLWDLLPRPSASTYQSDARVAAGWRRHGRWYTVANHRGALWMLCMNTAEALAQVPLPPGDHSMDALTLSPLEVAEPAVWMSLDGTVHTVSVSY
eukprot:TRINITY_DN1492_c1_g2_i1.p1 TRINITY_DN1492_c1_g2~~TRINITY_DN1492_c1_g2_i1.p1  ORF type:complete len:550 (+),score=115.60 TRINITY_DN1492_c1_g2_i1:186-1835(+)